MSGTDYRAGAVGYRNQVRNFISLPTLIAAAIMASLYLKAHDVCKGDKKFKDDFAADTLYKISIGVLILCGVVGALEILPQLLKKKS